MNRNHKHNNHEHHEHNHSHHHLVMMRDFKRRFFISSIITIPILLLSPLVQEILGFALYVPGNKYILLLISTFIFFFGGSPFLKESIKELKNKKPGMMTLISLAITVAYIYSTSVVFGLQGRYFFWELATLVDIMLLGHFIEMKSVIGASKALEKLAQLMPNTAHIIKKGNIVEINISDLKVNDIVLVKSGEKFPADGIILKGSGYINESLLTGESVPVKKNIGDKVIGGSINNDGTFEIKVLYTGEDAYLFKIIELVKNAQALKSETENLANTAAKWLTIIAIFAGISTFVYWILYGADLAFSIERLVTVMVITCPHALGLAIPLVNAVSTSVAAKNGLLIRNRTAFENVRKITTLVFDKTGTLTKGNFGITSIQSLDEDYNSNELLKIAASLEQKSEHPIAKAIIKHYKSKELYSVHDFKVLKGRGVEGKITNSLFRLLSEKSLKSYGINISNKINSNSVTTKVFIIKENKLIGVIELQDEIREESFQTIQTLKEMGIKCIMLTGDNERIARDIAQRINLDAYFAEVLPHEKQKMIHSFQKNGEYVAMIGDGINDAPALALANVGIAIGTGIDIAVETADIILVNSDLRDIIKLIRFGKATYTKMIQNLFWASGYNIIVIPIAAGIFYNTYNILITPAIGALLMSLSTIIVAINAKLLKLND